MSRFRRRWRPGSSTSISASGSFLLVVNLILLAAGNVMDPSSILLIMAPILFPLATKLGIHPVHLGVLMIVNTEVGTVPSAGRPQSLYRQQHREDGHQRNHGRGIAVAVRDADFPRPDYLHSRRFRCGCRGCSA